MELSRVQEEILLVLNNSDRALYEGEIIKMINFDRPKQWKKISQASLNRTLSRMVDKQLIEIAYVDLQNYNRKYYGILDEGLLSLMQSKDNRKRLGRVSNEFCAKIS